MSRGNNQNERKDESAARRIARRARVLALGAIAAAYATVYSPKGFSLPEEPRETHQLNLDAQEGIAVRIIDQQRRDIKNDPAYRPKIIYKDGNQSERDKPSIVLPGAFDLDMLP